MENVEKYIQNHRRRLEGYYTISVDYDQPRNEVKSHYNTIRICLKKGYSEADLLHELTHLKFMTEEYLIKYYYPIERFFEEKDRYIFINSLVNIVYDIYVDAYLSVVYEIDNGYFENKLHVYDTFSKNVDKVLKLKRVYINVITSAIDDYRKVLFDIVNGKRESIQVQKFISKNDIKSQRRCITEYLALEGLEDDFEWLTHRDIYEREQKNKK